MKLADFQNKLKTANLDAYIITRNNMFLGQDVLEEENKVLKLSGFSGSAGNLLIFQDKAILFIDGRYELQAKKAVDSTKIEIVCIKNENLNNWLQNNIKEKIKIGYNPWCHTISEVDYWGRALKNLQFIEDKELLAGNNLSAKEAEIFEHEIEFCGETMEEKIGRLLEFMQKNQLDAYFITSCDCVSWLLNLRSKCLDNTPIIRAFALVNKNGEVSLFTSDFNQLEVEFAKYNGQTIGVAYNHTPRKIFSLMKNHNIWLENLANPIQNWKAIKNPVEIKNLQTAHLQDGIALAKFLHWLENNWRGQSEISISDKLQEFRSQNKLFFSNSFDTIAGFGPNGAIVHYRPSAETNLKLEEGSLLLLDSGAQYFNGTTDVTRTLAIGKPSKELMDDFTIVLKAHIALANTYFPSTASGQSLDAIARSQLWKHGKDYAHGTGHGVGFFSNVHEGPQSISIKNSSAPLQENMILSIEPGYYKENAYGIRIENLVQVSKVEADFEFSQLKFAPLTLAPLDKRLINKYLLNKQEVEWINDYHKRVYAELYTHLDVETKQWLEEACQPL